MIQPELHHLLEDMTRGSPEFAPDVPIAVSQQSLVKIIIWGRAGDKPLPEAMMAN